MKKSKAFTLIELLVVVAIIAILSTIIVVNYTGVQNRAKQSATIESLNNIGAAVLVCLTDSTLKTPAAAGSQVCNDTDLVNVQWYTSPLNGYTVTIPSLTGSGVTTAPTVTGSGLPGITCAASNNTFTCKKN